MPHKTAGQLYRSGHRDAIAHARAGKHPVEAGVDDHYKSGYKDGLTQAHNLRVSIKEHELPYWAKS